MGWIGLLLRRVPMVGLVAGMALAASAMLVPQLAHASCTPLPPLITCPSPTPAAPVAAPVVSVEAPTAVGSRTATLNGTINPGGLVTSYSWVYADASGDYLGKATATVTLPAADSAEPVSTAIAGLRPGVAYTVTLYASSAQGDASAVKADALTTSSHPILSVAISSHGIVIAHAFTVTVRRSGSYDPYGSVQVDLARYPYRHWVSAGTGSNEAGSTVTVSPCPAGYQPEGGCPYLDRNFKVRAQIGTARSRARLVYVYPQLSFVTVRERYNASPFLDLTFTALVHRTAGRYPSGPVYFYESRSRGGPFTRIAVGSLRPHRSYDSEELKATARISNPGSVYTESCLRRQLVPDMGRPFLDRGCGPPQQA